MKYIDAEKLITILEEKKAQRDQWYERYGDTVDGAKADELSVVIEIITSLQQEQPEVDLEKEITAYIERNFHIRYDETLEVGNNPLTTYDFEKIARHFYELGLNARK